MIKKVKTDELRVGVYVNDYICKRGNGKIYIAESFIQSEKAIQIIKAWDIEEVYIDTEKGLDVKPGESALEIRQKIDKKMRLEALRSRPQPSLTPLKEELTIARKIKEEAITTVKQAMNAVENGTTLQLGGTYQLIEKMEQSVTRNRDALLLLMRIRNKDEYTLQHSISVSSLMLAFCNFCGLTYDTTLNMAMGALFHDIGKTQIPLHILNKPGRLSPQEMEIIKKHTEYSAEVMALTKDLPYEAFDIALHHHERNDGSGYPHALKEDSIGFASKIASICDVFDALTSERCYKSGISRVSGLRKLYEWSDYHFDKELVYKFISLIGVYPIGTCVKLENGQIGVVTGSTENMLQPVVRLFYDDKKKAATKVREVDLLKEDINIENYESTESWDAGMRQTYRQLKSNLNPLQEIGEFHLHL